MITRLAHVCLHVKDLQRSTDFYTRLGFMPRFRFTREGKPYGIYLEIAPSQYIEFFEDPQMEAPINTGLVHFCLESDSLDALMRHLSSQGIPYTPRKRGCDHTDQIWIRDPDGNNFEVHQYTPQSMQQQGGTVEVDW